MLIYKAVQVVSINKNEPKPWEMGGKSGVAHSAQLACVSSTGEVSSIKIKAKTGEELDAKLKIFTPGKAAEIRIHDVVPMFRAGDRKASGYELIG